MQSPLLSPRPDEGGGSFKLPQRPGPLQVSTTAALKTIVHDALRERMRALHGDRLPEFCSGSASLERFFSRDEAHDLLRVSARDLMLPLPKILNAQSANLENGLSAMVCQTILGSEFMARAPQQIPAKSHTDKVNARLDTVVCLNSLREKLNALETEIKKGPEHLTHRLVRMLTLEEVAAALLEENSMRSLATVACFYGFETLARTVLPGTSATSFFYNGQEIVQGLQLRDPPKALIDFDGRLSAALETRCPEVRTISEFGEDNLVALVGNSYVGEIPEGVSVTTIPLRYGEKFYGAMVLCVCINQPVASIPHSTQRELEWLFFKAGEAAFLLESRVSSNLSSSEAPKSSRGTEILADDSEYAAGGAVCRRFAVRVGEEIGVVFISDRNTSGRSITNQFEQLRSKSVYDLKLAGGQHVRWFERRTGEHTASGVPQSECFAEVVISEGKIAWQPAHGSLAQKIAQILGFTLSNAD